MYVGDEGVVEPGGQALRRGIDVSARWQAASWLFFDADYNYTHPRATDEPEGANYIPLAPLQSSAGGVTVRDAGGFSGSLRYRYLADRPGETPAEVMAQVEPELPRSKWERTLRTRQTTQRPT